MNKIYFLIICIYIGILWYTVSEKNSHEEQDNASIYWIIISINSQAVIFFLQIYNMVHSFMELSTNSSKIELYCSSGKKSSETKSNKCSWELYTFTSGLPTWQHVSLPTQQLDNWNQRKSVFRFFHSSSSYIFC